MFNIARRAQNGKIWLNVLISANCLLWLWPLGAEETPTEHITLAELQPPLKLLSETSADSSSSRQLRSKERLEESLQSDGIPQPAMICRAWGPYSEVNEVRELEQMVGAKGVETEVFQSEVRGDPDYLVYVGPIATPEGARRMLEELKSLGIESHFITQGRYSDTLSVGVFSQEARAIRQQERVSALGYQVVIEELHHPQQVYHLLANVPADFVSAIAPNGCRATLCTRSSKTVERRSRSPRAM